MADTHPESASASEAHRSGLPDTVVVFGASGFIGRNLVAHLQGRVRRLIAVTPRGTPIPGTEPVAMGDVSRLNPGSDCAVVHLAAVRYDAANFAQAQSELLVANTDIANQVYRFCMAAGVREIRLASSIAVYPGGAVKLDDRAPLDLAQDPAASETMYGWSKRIAEIYARLYHEQHGLNTLAFRLSNPYGPMDSLDETRAHVVPAFILRALRGERPFAIKGSPDATRDFIYVGDVCEIIVESLRRRGAHGVYNLATGMNTPIGGLARAILELVGEPTEVVAGGTSHSRVVHRVCTVERLHRDFAGQSYVPLREGLGRTIQWVRDALAQS